MEECPESMRCAAETRASLLEIERNVPVRYPALGKVRSSILG